MHPVHPAAVRAARKPLFPQCATLPCAPARPAQPAPWGFYVWGVIYAYQGMGVLYAMVPAGYGTDGTKETLVRIAGACWPFGWTCEIIWQARRRGLASRARAGAAPRAC